MIIRLWIEALGIERLIFIACYVLLAILGGALLFFSWEWLRARYEPRNNRGNNDG
jgi:hypothetical protein